MFRKHCVVPHATARQTVVLDEDYTAKDGTVTPLAHRMRSVGGCYWAD
jgi:hypothetical protein